MKKIDKLSFLLPLSFLLFLGCSEENEPGLDPSIVFTSEPVVQLNPSTYAPLTASISFSLEQGVAVKIRVVGKNGSASDVIKQFPSATDFDIPILGLYPDFDNTVELTFLGAQNDDLGTQIFNIQTAPLSSDIPQITINTPAKAGVKPGFNFVNNFGHNSQFLPQRPFVFDQFGDVRWYLDYSGHPILANLFYDLGMFRLQNGNLFFGDGNSGAIYEINMLGEILNTWSLQGFGFHHIAIEKPNGNFLVTVNNNNIPTVEDWIIEIDRNSGAIVRQWDLNQSLDNKRRAWNTNLADINVDWFHANGLVYYETDNTILVSGRTQGLVKLTENNEVIWIMAPHKDWVNAGNGQGLKQFLLQPLDVQGQPITDTQVLEGNTNHPDFEWAWYQHSPVLLPNGNLILFDNGDNRNYQGLSSYSRAVIFEIDEGNKTVKQLWQYGKERGTDTYSQIVSGVRFHEEENNVLFCPGGTSEPGTGIGKVVEVDLTSKEVLFEATITASQTVFNIAFHNVNRMGLYPD